MSQSDILLFANWILVKSSKSVLISSKSLTQILGVWLTTLTHKSYTYNPHLYTLKILAFTIE